MINSYLDYKLSNLQLGFPYFESIDTFFKNLLIKISYVLVCPPSTLNIEPVIKSDLGEAK